MTTPLDDLELELRKLPGVRAAGFDERDDMLLVQLHVSGERTEHPVPLSASRIAARHADVPVAVEVVRWRSPAVPAAAAAPAAAVAAPVEPTEPAAPAPAAVAPGPEGVVELTTEEERRNPAARPRLLAVLAFPDTDELEVHLILHGRRTIGRAPASRGLVGATDATIAAMHGLGAVVEAVPRWARALEDSDDDRVLVSVAIDVADGPVRYGLAAGASPVDAAARATLDALNRSAAYAR